jgi:hypothetical protein
MFNNFFSENRVVYEIMWKKEYDAAGKAKDDNTIRRMRRYSFFSPLPIYNRNVPYHTHPRGKDTEQN